MPRSRWLRKDTSSTRFCALKEMIKIGNWHALKFYPFHLIFFKYSCSLFWNVVVWTYSENSVRRALILSPVRKWIFGEDVFWVWTISCKSNCAVLLERCTHMHWTTRKASEKRINVSRGKARSWLCTICRTIQAQISVLRVAFNSIVEM